MDPGDVYRLKAAEIGAKARQETNLILRAELKKLALAYLLLAEQAESNARTDVVYETPPERPAAPQQQPPSNKSSNRRV
jgi:hypothetical protein